MAQVGKEEAFPFTSWVRKTLPTTFMQFRWKVNADDRVAAIAVPMRFLGAMSDSWMLAVKQYSSASQFTEVKLGRLLRCKVRVIISKRNYNNNVRKIIVIDKFSCKKLIEFRIDTNAQFYFIFPENELRGS